MTNITVLVPSRGRPDNIERLIRGFNNTRQLWKTHLVVGVDDDDPMLEEYLALKVMTGSFEIVVGPRLRLGGTLNALAPKYLDADILGFMGDDHLPQTVGWDSQIANAMQTGGVVYGNDLFQSQNLPTAVFFDSKVVETLGYFVPHGLIHLYFDNIWKDWGEATGKLVYLHDTIIEHIHPAAGKGEVDAGYIETNDSAVWTNDGTRYEQYKASGEFAADIEKLRAL